MVNAPMIRVSKEFNEFINQLSKETMLSKVNITKIITRNILNKEDVVIKIKKNGKHKVLGFRLQI